jgi:hypothetical protein
VEVEVEAGQVESLEAVAEDDLQLEEVVVSQV